MINDINAAASKTLRRPKIQMDEDRADAFNER